MSLKNLTRSIVLATVAAACAASAPAETTAGSSTPPMKTASMHVRRDDRSALSATAQSDLIGELLGIAGSKSTQEALSPSRTDSASLIQLVARQSATTAKPATAKSDSQNGNGSLGSMFGRLIRIDVDTNTVDIQFEGSRRTTVGSKFSVEHDYAFTREYLGKIEIIYLAGGNRAIAKPVDKTDITKMGKGDRVGGRIVPNPKGTSAGGATQSATGNTSPRADAAATDAPQAQKQSCPSPSCVKPQVGELPQPPPDATVPYSPDKDGMWEEPAPAPEKTQPTFQVGPPLASGAARLAPRDKWNGPLARTWGIRLNRNSPAKILATRRSPSPTTPPWRSKSLWCAVQPKPAESPGPTQTAALPPRLASLPAVVLFESE